MIYRTGARWSARCSSFSYVRHSTFGDLLDEATILDPELTARIMHDVRHDMTASATGNLLRFGGHAQYRYGVDEWHKAIPDTPRL